MYLFKLIRFWAIKGRFKISSLQARFWEEFGKQSIENKDNTSAEIALRKFKKISNKRDHLIAKMEDLFAE